MEAREVTDVNGFQYSGKIDRHRLIGFCQDELPRIDKANEKLLDALYYAEQGNNIHTIHAINEGLMENYGYVKALRAVCDWARATMEEPEPVDLLDINELRDKFNAGK